MLDRVLGKLLVVVVLVSLLLVTGLAVAQIRATHPRIWLTDALLADLRARAAANDREWVILKGDLDARLTGTILDNAGYVGGYWGTYAPSYALGYLVLKDSNPALAQQYANKALTLMTSLARDLQTRGDNLGGAANVMPSSGYAFRNYAIGLAIVYDWLYDYPDFTATLKTEFSQSLNAFVDWCTTGCYAVGTAPPIVINNFYPTYLLGVAVTGYATYGDNPRAQEHIDNARNRFNTAVVPVYTGDAKGGDSPEGMSYGTETFWRLLAYLQTVKTATGEDLSATFPWSREVLFAYIHQLKPGRGTTSDHGGWPGAYTGVPYREAMQILSQLFRGTQEGRFAQFWLQNLTRLFWQGEPWFNLLWYNPNASAESYYNQPLSYLSPGTGLITMRSAWTDTAVWASFKAGPCMNIQAPFDNGSFVIDRGTDRLVIRASQWKGTQGWQGDEPVLHFDNTTIYNNTLLVNDPGDRNLSDPPNQVCERWNQGGKIKALKDGGSYLYAQADIADAYAPPQGWITYAGKQNAVTNFTREFVYFRPNAFVIFDRVSTLDERYTKRWAIHFRNEPTIAGDTSQATFGNSKVFLKTLAPSPATVTKIAEPDRSNVNPALTWRLEVKTPDAQVSTQYLHALYVTDSNALSMPNAERIAGTGLVGAHIQSDPVNWVVMFSSSQTGAPPTGTISYTITPTGPTKHLVMNLQPNTGYTLSVTPDGSRQVITLTATGSNTHTSGEGGLAFEVSFDGATVTDLSTGAPTAAAPATTTPVTLASLTPSVASPQAPGASITWTANASGGSSPLQYRFMLWSGAAWNMVRDYSTSNSWSWNPTSAGDYSVSVWVKEQTSTNQYDATLSPVAYSISAPASPVVLSALTPSVASPQAPGASITWTANASGGSSSLQYRFMLLSGGTWNTAQDYSTSNTWTWVPANSGDYAVSVWVKEQNSTKQYDVALDPAVPYSMSAPVTPVTLSSLTPSVPGPKAAGTSISWSASASGGTSPLQYRFWLWSGGAWNMVQDYSPSKTWTWNPANPGDYAVSVWVKEQNSTKQQDVALDPAVPYSISAPVVLSSLTPNVSGPQPRRTYITWTANASGGSIPLLYRFLLSSGGTLTVARDYSTSSTWTWRPTKAGNYTVFVWVKEQNSTSQYDVAQNPGVPYTIK